MVKQNKNLPIKKESNTLIFVNGSERGISRKRAGKLFAYYYESKKIKDPETIERIKKLAIPPAWTDVWICVKANGHLQATGFDARHRKQYRYHPQWNSMRNEKKFEKLYEFGKALPNLRRQIEKDISEPQLSLNKILATVIQLMERTYIRIGNNIYEKEYGSYGLTTLKDRHVRIEGSNLKLSFVGKKGIKHSITLYNKKLARIIKQSRDIPGKELFQYYGEDGAAHPVDSGKVNAYIKELTKGDFTAKDFRTWAGSLNMLRALRKMKPENKVGRIKKNVLEALDFVSQKLGNTRMVCRKYYVHPILVSLYETNCLLPYLKELDKIEKKGNKGALTCEEIILLRIISSVKVQRRRKAA